MKNIKQGMMNPVLFVIILILLVALLLYFIFWAGR